MAYTDQQKLMLKLQETLGGEEAGTLMGMISDDHSGDITQVKTDVAVLKTDVAELKTDVAVLKTDVAELKTDVAVLKTDVAELKTDVAILKTDMVWLKDGFTELSRKMSALGDDMSRLEATVLRTMMRHLTFSVSAMLSINTLMVGVVAFLR